MLPECQEANFSFKKITKLEAFKLLGEKEGIEKISAIGHADMAAVIASELGLQVESNRISVALKEEDEAVIAQYRGARLAEGTVELPENSTIEYWHVRNIKIMPVKINKKVLVVSDNKMYAFKYAKLYKDAYICCRKKDIKDFNFKDFEILFVINSCFFKDFEGISHKDIRYKSYDPNAIFPKNGIII